MQEITEFVDVMPTKSIATGLACVRAAISGTLPSIPKKDVELAVANIVLYGAGLVSSKTDPPLMQSAESLTNPMPLAECESHLVSLLPDTSGKRATMKKIGDGTLLKLFETTLLPLLIKFLPLLV